MPAPPNPVVHEEPCPDGGGSCAYVDDTTDPRYGAWIDPTHDEFDRAHELGHLFDAQVLTDEDRAWFTPRLGFHPGTPWVGAEYEQSPSERFADAYAACDLGLIRRAHIRGALITTWYTQYGYRPSQRTHRRVCFTIQFTAWYRA